MKKLTKSVVEKTTPGDSRFYVWDVEVKGFGLLVLPSGNKSYVYQYRTPEGRTRRATIGRHSATLTAEQARAKAKAMRRAVEDGHDPLGDRQARRKAITVSQLFDLYLASGRFAEKADSTRAIDRGRIDRHLRPTLGKFFVHKLTTEAVRRAFAQIRDGATAVDERTGERGRAIVTGGPGTARSAIRLLRAVFQWAIDEGLASTNPATKVQVGTDGQRDTIIDDVAGYERLFRTLDRMQGEHRIRPAAADAIRVIALTGARRGEITGLRWRHVQLQDAQIVLPPSGHKTGRKTGKPRVIGLPAAAQAIIAGQPEGKPDDFVFRPAKGVGAIAIAQDWRRVRVEADLPEGIGLHGLRHSLASSLAMNGAQAAEIMEALGHRQLSTSQRYVHWANSARATLAEKAAAHISAALEGKPKAKVKSIKGKRRRSTATGSR
jgi:integrase